MKRQNSRIRIDDDGRLEVVDPGFDSLALLRAVDPDFRVQRKPLTGFVSPRFLTLRSFGCGISIGNLNHLSTAVLWFKHAAALELIRNDEVIPTAHEGELSLLDLKIELARRNLSNCHLCAHRCGVDRLAGELGVCSLGTAATVAERFVHIAEEAPINPSLVLNLAGCGLRCQFCQQFDLLAPGAVVGEDLGGELWSKLETKGARSLSFIGGNPDESLYAILRFLRDAPGDWKLPVVWNCHGYATHETVGLLEGVVDVFVPDFKYGNDECGRRLSKVPSYLETTTTGIAAMAAQGVPVIVRILVLPEHFDCCHAPSLQFLASLPDRKTFFVSVRGQYCPDWKITSRDGALGRRVSVDEVNSVRQQARDLGLQLID
jgi:putative pyruvate formate lyase activating enzyme